MNTDLENSVSPHENIPSTEWTGLDQRVQNECYDSEETLSFDPDEDSKIKPEVELKEGTDNHIYKADFRGHLQLVSVAQGVPIQCGEVDKNQSEDVQQVVIWQEESEDSSANLVCSQLKSMSDGSVEERYCSKEAALESYPRARTYVHSLPEIYDYSSDSTWEDNSSQLSGNLVINENILLTQAEKKRLYRMRIQKENPAMWSSIKKKEAARKREQREKRRHIILEMQKAMDLSSLPDSPEVLNQRLYLEALKERYPELWSQLTNALPATERRNEQLFNARNIKSRRHVPKPAKMYKDVIEAQKKRLYRQRIKEERPEMYERQKARDAYARSIQRLLLKKKLPPENDEYKIESFHPEDMEKKLTYLHDTQPDDSQHMKSKKTHLDFRNEMSITDPNLATVPTPMEVSSSIPDALTQAPNAEGLPSTSVGILNHFCSSACDNNHSENSYCISENSSNSCNNKVSERNGKKESQQINETTFPKDLSEACSTQSDILWYWNDVKGSQCTGNVCSTSNIPCAPYRKGPQILTEEERVQKILKERTHLKEKRRRYRLSMTPEKRNEFLEIERERLKAYRLRKKAAESCLVSSCQNTILCVDQ